MDDTLGSNNSIDPFKLVAGEYAVHRKYGIGQFLGMKVLNVESASGDVQNKPFLFLKYKDATAKISPDSSRRLLYRYCSPGGLVKPSSSIDSTTRPLGTQEKRRPRRPSVVWW